MVVTAHEIGGRWGEEAFDFVQQLARAKARSAPDVLKAAATRSWLRRWTTLVSIANQDAFAASLLDESLEAVDGETPCLHEVFAADRL